MNAEVKPLHAQAQTVKPNQIIIVGRIDSISKYDGKFDHIITLAAVDEFSKPSVLRLSSSEKLGNTGEITKCLAVFNGWPNNYESKNGEKVKDARGFFVAVE